MSMIFHSIAQWRTYQKHHLGQQQLGVVLTMGNLHQGHLALCAESQRNNDATVVSIFVNPTQFNDPRDYECYPRTIAADIDCLRQQKVDFILLPQADELYADQFCYQVSENSIAKQLEGEFRPGHFTGMLTIVLKLLLGIGAHRAYFGEKDYQQYLLIKGMVKSFFINCEIIACPIVRESSALPFSSRNQRLSVDERVVAEKVAKIFNQPQMPLDAIRCDLLALGVEIDYLCEQYERRLMAVRVGEIRLLDNYSMEWIGVKMTFQDICTLPGHHHLLVAGPVAEIEVIVSVPEQVNTQYFALIGHPHPLQEGTMNNKVVTTTGRSLLKLHIPVIRFNFRGVGQSGGEFDHGLGETDDMLYLIELWQASYPEAKLILSGFSFGSYVAFLAAQKIHPQCLILIAPPVHRFSYDLTSVQNPPSVIFQGDQDEVVPKEQVAEFAVSFPQPIPIEWFKETGHFFHGKLIELSNAVQKWVQACL